jgi:hypothetical protein
MLFDGNGTRMTPSHAVKKDTRYRYYVSRSLITKDRTGDSAGLRVPAAEIEQLVTSRVRQWLLAAAASTRRLRRGSLIRPRGGGLPHEPRTSESTGPSSP